MCEPGTELCWWLCELGCPTFAARRVSSRTLSARLPRDCIPPPLSDRPHPCNQKKNELACLMTSFNGMSETATCRGHSAPSAKLTRFDWELESTSREKMLLFRRRCRLYATGSWGVYRRSVRCVAAAALCSRPPPASASAVHPPCPTSVSTQHVAPDPSDSTRQTPPSGKQGRTHMPAALHEALLDDGVHGKVQSVTLQNQLPDVQPYPARDTKRVTQPISRPPAYSPQSPTTRSVVWAKLKTLT
jgi:hypothetical protein